MTMVIPSYTHAISSAPTKCHQHLQFRLRYSGVVSDRTHLTYGYSLGSRQGIWMCLGIFVPIWSPVLSERSMSTDWSISRFVCRDILRFV